ncbi:MAG: glutathione S-transferase N-terminal domain-containing protein [Solirubrobacteraceae bacterium]|nr:glutathione S-transferase N-terminal domain-containing protein [Solirubrobacteraceae bacterium]
MATTTLFIIHGSHPCETVRRALEIKGIEHRVVEWPPGAHAPLQKALFGRRTVPGIRFPDGRRMTGSRAILRALDDRVPDPPLLPADPTRRAAVLEAERWGDRVLQPIPRRVLWFALDRAPRAIPTYQERSRLPLPAAIVPLVAPAIVGFETRLNKVNPASVRADLVDLPRHLDRIDGWLADGTLGGDGTPSAADLQIAASLRLLMTIGDLHGPIAARPAGALALRLYPEYDGDVPAGTLPAEWLEPLAG